MNTNQWLAILCAIWALGCKPGSIERSALGILSALNALVSMFLK